MELVPILIRKFDGGWNSETASDEINLNESPDMFNADFTKSGSVKKTDGSVELGSDADADINKCLAVASNRNGTDWLFKFVGTNLKIYDDVNNVYTVMMTGLTSGLKWGYDDFNNVIIFVSQVDAAMSFDLGKITRLNGAILNGAATIDVDDASQLATPAGTVVINGVEVSYTGRSGTQLTGCTGAIATPDNYLVTPKYTAHSGIPKGNMCINFGGRLIVAGVLDSGASTIYGSKATDRTNFTIAGGGAANDAFAEALPAKVNCIRKFLDDNSEERIMAFLNNNIIESVNVVDDATLGTLVSHTTFKQGVTALNHFSSVVGPNDIFHIDINKQVRTLGPNQTSTNSSTRNFSDTISANHRSLFRDNFNFDNSSAVILDNEYWCICRNENDTYNDTIIIWDMIQSAWRKRTGILANDIIAYNNSIVIASATLNKIYQIKPGELSDDNGVISFKYSLPDLDYNPLNVDKLRGLRISGIISSDCEFKVKVYSDFASNLLEEFVIRGDNTKITSTSSGDSGSFGNVVFGGVPFGGQDVPDRKFFMAQLNLKGFVDLENFRPVVENEQAGVYLEISKVKPIIATHKDEYFPGKFISN